MRKSLDSAGDHAMLPYLIDNWISIAALAVSSFLLWRDYLMPFRLDVRSVGRISVAPNPFSSGLRQASVILDLLFANTGSRRGVVEDLAIQIRGPKGATLLRSQTVLLDRKLRMQKDEAGPTMEAFLAFDLTKGERLVKRILFVPVDGRAEFSFEPGPFRADVYARSSHVDAWRRYEALEFTVDAEDVKGLATSKASLNPDGTQLVSWTTRNKLLDASRRGIEQLQKQLQDRGTQ
jgi:hypothetical protein